jgi:hypothetical protein
VACANPSPPPCPPDAGATCDASGACVGKIIVGAVCQINCDDLFHDPQNQDVRTCQPNGICDFSIDSKGNSVGADIPCPSVPTGCAPGACDPQINACAYPVNPNGTLVCNSDVGCCPGQICLYPPGCDSNPGGCVGRFCYYPNSVP